jgi:hypothetical protein
MSMPTDPLSIATQLSGGLLGGLKMFGSQSSPFANTPTQNTNMSGYITAFWVIFVIMLLMGLLSVIAVYKLTDSGLQALLCFLFGMLYLIIAIIYYGFSGYKLIKRS